MGSLQLIQLRTRKAFLVTYLANTQTLHVSLETLWGSKRN